MSEDITYRHHRYLTMTGIRVNCFATAIILYVGHMRWLVLVPAAGAIFIPCIAVVFANGGREPDNVRGFTEHRMNLRPAATRPTAPGSSVAPLVFSMFPGRPLSAFFGSWRPDMFFFHFAHCRFRLPTGRHGMRPAACA
jgi:hypothetical protein